MVSTSSPDVMRLIREFEWKELFWSRREELLRTTRFLVFGHACYEQALELYAEAFEAAGALDKLEAFASWHGADFYGLPRNTGKVTLKKAPWEVPAEYPFGDETVVPLRAGQQIAWRFAD